MQLGNVKGDAAMFADQEKARFAPSQALCALNDNESGRKPAVAA